MVIKIMDMDKVFENKNSEISKVFDYINSNLENKMFF